MKRQKARNRFRSQLQIEALEQRQLMAGLAATLNQSTKTLTIAGTEQADVIAITQNDTMNKVTVVSGLSGSTTQHFAANFVNRVVVQLGSGDDQFTYKTVRDVWNRKDIQLDFGGGDDTGRFFWAEDGGTARANVNLSMLGGDGNDAFAARIGRAGYATNANIQSDMGAGDDGFVVQALNPDSALEKLSINASGGEGNDSLEYYASGPLAWSANTTVRLDGQAGDDTFQFENNGRVDGELSETLVGGAGNDDFTSVVGDGSGYGRYKLNVEGNIGDDTMLVDIRTPKSRPFSAQVSLDGGTGDDTAYAQATTTPQNVESNNLLTVQLRPPLLESFDPILPTHTMRAANRTIEYWTKGWSEPNAPVIVLLSGAGTAIDSWVPIASGLNGVGQVISVNKPGYGRTDLPGKNAYSQTIIEDIRSVVAKLAPGRQIILVGHSIGGPYASLFARLYPSEVAGVIFEDSTEQVRVDPDAYLLTSAISRVYPAGLVAEYAALGRSINAPLDAPAFPKIPVIGLFEELPPEALPFAQAYADLGYPGSLQIVADAGHFIHVDQPEVVINAIKSMVRKTEISGILSEVAAKYGVPGLSASVIVGDRVLTGAAGVRVAGTTAAIKVSDRFGVGSETKAMTATLAGVLVERGVLRWDSTLSQLFPELRASMQPAYLNVTIEQLLQHRGGIVADDDASEQLAEKVAAYSGPASQSRLALLPEILKEPLPGAVGEFRYSNAGYAAAAAMMERATGVPYERLMQRYIFNPLGMFSATFDPPVSNPLNPRQPIGHLPDGTPAPGDRPPADYLGDVLRPAGADLRMNIADWSKFVRVHLGESIHGFRLVKPETLARLQLPVQTDDEPLVGYGMGWGVFPAELAGLDARYGRVLNHLGSDGVWLAEVDAFPDIDFSIQILANGTVDKNGNSLESGAFEEIKLRLFHRFAPKLDGIPQGTSKTATPPLAILAAPPVERMQPQSESQYLASSTPYGDSSSTCPIPSNGGRTANYFGMRNNNSDRPQSTFIKAKSNSPSSSFRLAANVDAVFADLLE